MCGGVRRARWIHRGVALAPPPRLGSEPDGPRGAPAPARRCSRGEGPRRILDRPRLKFLSWFELIETLEVLPDGIEGWNSKYDGRYAPRPATFELIARLQNRRPQLRAFYGQDLHWRRQYAGLFTLLDVPVSERTLVLQAMRGGAFEGCTETLRLPADGQLSSALLEGFARRNARSQQFRAALRSTKALMGGAFRLVPASVKAQLRRFF